MTAFNSMGEENYTFNSDNLSFDDKSMTTTSNEQSFGEKRKPQDQNEADYLTTTTTTTTRRRRRRQVVTDQSSTTTTTTRVEKRSRRSSSQRSIPAFLHKLFNMVNDSLTTQFIRWSKDGNSFLVEDHEKFAELVLPRFYKHNTFASFVRQLNMYDFHKIPHIQQGVLITIDNTENEVWEFSHANFKRDRPDLLVSIARKRNKDRNNAIDMETMELGSVVKEISIIKNHQANVTEELKNLQRDNEKLLKEALAAKVNYSRQQEAIAKILQFLTVVFSNDLPQLNNSMVHDQLQQLRQGQKQNDYHQESLFSSPKINNVGNTGSDSTGTCESGSDMMEDDLENSNSDNDFIQDDVTLYKELSSNTTNNTECFHAENFFNELDDIKVLVDLTPSVFDTSILDKENNTYTSRSTETITHDISELQDNVETLVVHLGEEVASGYDTMLSSASKNDKLRLFELATQASPQTQTLTQFVQSGDTKSAHPQMQDPLNQPAPCTSSNNSSLSGLFPHLLTSVEPYHADTFYQSNTIPTTTPKMNTSTVNSQLDHTGFKNNTKTYDLEQCGDQADQLFRANVSIQQRLQASKYHPLRHPHQGAYYTSQQTHQTSFNNMLNSSVSSYQATYHPFYNSQRLQ
ncbi:hypothetical protein HPULCUR_009112 [Helicostylum pulchrum]|uniref:HSF-type DNA-binding domain-containing protein n=1 Tax=Helicostylum pulchrum TaxID=562976 RepID=A0ABP9Y9I8_9FUNG